MTWHGAAWAVRRDIKSQGGLIVGISERRLLSGERAPVNVMAAQSKRVPRVCRSSVACETQSCTMALEDMDCVRAVWGEVHSPGTARLQDYVLLIKSNGGAMNQAKKRTRVQG